MESNNTLTRKVLIEKVLHVICDKYDYYETNTSIPKRCKLIDIVYDKYFDLVIYEFRYDDSITSAATVYPKSLKPIKNGE